MVVSVNTKPVIKKRTNKFNRHQSDRYKSVKVRNILFRAHARTRLNFVYLSIIILTIAHHLDFIVLQTAWRKPKGIDNRVRRRFKGQQPMPKIGYGTNKNTRHMSSDGFKRIVVSNVADLDTTRTRGT